MATGASERVRTWGLIAVCMLAFAISASLRLVEVRRWDPEVHKVDGEYLLATHDAYAWVSGAAHADARTAAQPMAKLLSALDRLTCFSPASLAFWLPPFLVGLSAIVIALWADRLGARPLACLSAGVLGTCAPAVFSRTRLGYFDTDWATLFFPLLIGWLVSEWFKQRTRSPGTVSAFEGRAGWGFGHSIAFTLFLPVSRVWHGYIPACTLATLLLASLLIFFAASSNVGRKAYLELFSFALAGVLGWTGALLGIVTLLAERWIFKQIRISKLPPWIIPAVLIALLTTLAAILFEDYLLIRFRHYFQITIDGPAGLPFPELSSSVRETQSINLVEMLTGAGYTWWLGILGITSYLLILIKRPDAVLLAPSLALGLLAPRIGVRFAMFVAPVIFIGVTVLVSWLLQSQVSKNTRQAVVIDLVSVALVAVALPWMYRSYRRLPVETVLSRPHAEALIALDQHVDADGLIWTWWDYGYAAQYFTGMPTFADGGRNSGPYLFVLARVLGSDSVATSASVIKATAVHDFKPWLQWDRWGEAALDEWFALAAAQDTRFESRPPQYLVVQWDAIAYLSWIQYYGSWDFSTQSGSEGEMVYRFQPLELDLQKGVFIERGGQRFELKSADLLDPNGTEHYEYSGREDGLHLLLNVPAADVYLMGRREYRSALTQLLIAPMDPETGSINGYVLLVDRLPDARVFQIQ